MPKFNKNSDSYIMVFAVVMTVVLGAILSFVSLSLAETQKAERDLEQMRYILSSALGIQKVKGFSKEETTRIFNARVTDIVVDAHGKVVAGKRAKDIFVNKQYKIKPSQRQLPVYLVAAENDSSKVECYVVPTYGFGLWDNIWGFFAFGTDFKTLKGVVLDHKAETPGLGARITEEKVQMRFNGKKVYGNDGSVQLKVMKGEGHDYSDEPGKVDGISGSTLTTVGINNMVADYMALYKNYFDSQKELKK